MTTRSAKLYQGEDQSPVVDYTDSVIWEESEFGTRAHNGEGSASNVVIRDPLGETGSSVSLPSGLSFKTLPSKSLFLVEVDSSLLYRGRVGIKNYSRGGQNVDRYRQVDVSLHDTHWDLDHIFVHNYARPLETDKARTQGIIASYLSGNGRPTTVLNGSNYISASNPVTLPAQTYNRTSPLGMLREIAISANKQFFVTGDTIGGGSLFYDGNDSTAYACPFTISDRATEVAANPGSYFPPIWNVGPASSEDGSEQIDEVRYFYGSGDDSYVTVHSDVVHTQYGHASVTIYDDTAETAAEATVRAESVLSHRRREDRTYNVTIGPLTDAQVVQIKHGMTIPIKARAIPDADDAFQIMRIGQCRYTTPVAGAWFAHLQLGRPWKMQAYAVGEPAMAVNVPDVHDCSRAVPCIDTFTRTFSPGLGTSEIQGFPWESGDAFHVDGQDAVFPHGASGSSYLGGSPEFTSPIEIKFLMAHFGTVPPSGLNELVVFFGPTLGMPSNNDPSFAASWTSAGAIGLSLGGKNTAYGPVGGGLAGYSSNREFWCRVRVDNTQISAKTWYHGDDEPSAWDAQRDSDPYTTQQFGFLRQSGGTNQAGVRVLYLEIVEGLSCTEACQITGGPGASSGGSGQAADAAHDHDSVDTGDAAGGVLSGTYPNPGFAADMATQAELDGHITDTTDAHDASAVSVDTTGFTNSAGDDAQEVLADLDAAISSGGIPATIVDAKGDLIVATAADTVARRAVGADGTVLTADSAETTGVKWATPAAGAGAIDPLTQLWIYDDLFWRGTTGIYNGGVTASVSGTSAAASDASGSGAELGHPGIVQLSTGTTTTGRAGLVSTGITLGKITLSAGGVAFATIIKTPSSLSDGSQTYKLIAGLGDQDTADGSNSIIFRYTHSVNSGRWQGVVRDDIPTEVAIDTGTTVAVNTWYRLGVVVNSAGTEVEFFIDGVSVGTIDDSTVGFYGTYGLIPLNIIKSAGSTARFARVDAYWLTVDVSR